MKKIIGLLLSTFMFFGVPFPVYASEQLAENQNAAVEAQNSPQLEETDIIIDGSVSEAEKLPEDILTNIEDSVENAEELNVMPSTVEQEDEPSRDETDLITAEQELEIIANEEDLINLNPIRKAEPEILAIEEDKSTNTASLTIIKDLKGSSYMDPNQMFLFVVTNVNDMYQIEVAIRGKSSITIDGLKFGAYTVQEVTDWSWRYEINGIVVSPSNATAPAEFENGKKISLNANFNDVKITFSNEKTNTKWLTGDSFAINLFGRVNQTDAVVKPNEEDDES